MSNFTQEQMELMEVGKRIRHTRELVGLSQEQMAKNTGVTLDDYAEYESGRRDFNFTFIYKCAKAFGVDPTDLLKGSSPTLKNYELSRGGQGLPITRQSEYQYKNLAAMFKISLQSPTKYIFPTAKKISQTPSFHITTVRNLTF